MGTIPCTGCIKLPNGTNLDSAVSGTKNILTEHFPRQHSAWTNDFPDSVAKEYRKNFSKRSNKVEFSKQPIKALWHCTNLKYSITRTHFPIVCVCDSAVSRKLGCALNFSFSMNSK